MERFSKQNIDKLVAAPRRGLIHSFRKLIGPVIDFSGLIAAVGLTVIYFWLKLPSFVLILVGLFVILQLVLCYYIFIKFNKIKVNRYSLDLGIGKEVSFVFVSDFHIGKEYTSTKGQRLEDLINTINHLNPELVLLGGDFLTHKIETEQLAVLQYIKGKTRLGVFGNHDAEYLDNNVEYNTPTDFLEAFSQTNIPLLINQNQEVELNGVKLTIAGIPDLYSKTFNLEEAFENSSKDSVKILLSHNPDIIDFISETDNIDLVLSGHNHSGQIYLPPFGAIFPMPTKRKWLTRGIFNINKRTKLFLSQGVGYSGSRLRINTDSEVCLITIY